MNLKEAFRFQNKLQSLMYEADNILSSPSNITKVETTLLRHKVMAEAEDETTFDLPTSEYSEQITEVAAIASMPRVIRLLTAAIASGSPPSTLTAIRSANCAQT